MIDNYYNITPQQINYILELNRERNFNRASKNCFVTQPTLSMQIKKVEELLGFELFDRVKNPIEPTLKGEKLIEILKDVQSEYSKIGVFAQKMHGSYILKLKIAIIPTISSYLTIPIFNQLETILPDIQLSIHELKSEELILAMNNAEYDLGIMAGPYSSKRLDTKILYQEEIKIYYPNSQKKTIKSNELKEEQPWLMSERNCLRTQMINFCNIQDGSASNQWNYEGGNIQILTQLVDLNGGYTLIPENFSVHLPHLKQLVDDHSGLIPARQIIALYPSKTSKKESINKLLKNIQTTFMKKNEQKHQLLGWND